MSWVLFETTESVIEVLWDIALAFFVVRLAFIYFLASFVSGAVLSYLLYTQFLPVRHLTTPQSELAIVPLLAVLTVFWSRFLIAHYEIPRVAAFRVAIGAVAVVFAVTTEFWVAVVLYEVKGRGAWIFETDFRAGLAFAGLLVFFGLMPSIMMIFESRRDEVEETFHGHEKKSIVDAVPTVRMTGKEEASKKKNI